MKLVKYLMLIISLTISTSAQNVTMVNARVVADNWVKTILEKNGHWEGSKNPVIYHSEKIVIENRELGYLFNIDPAGFIIVSLRKELAPIKAYSTSGYMDIFCENGAAGFITTAINREISAIEKKLGPLKNIKSSKIESILDVKYRTAWAELSKMSLSNFQEGEVLLTTDWEQGDPYNLFCPTSTVCGYDPRCPVGCVATAGAQIMKFWNWPPYGSGSPYNDTYDWINMPNVLTSGSSTAQINAVAELGREIGMAVGMDYCSNGGCQSSTNTYNMEGVYENQYRYSDMCNKIDRNDYSASDWFIWLQTQFDQNMPIQYRIPGHSVVADGWQETGTTPIKQYHINYGHGPDAVCDNHPKTFWYTLDAICGGNPDEEYMLVYILPGVQMWQTLDQTYTRNPSFPYRYFNIDAYSIYDVIFESGQNLQFLPGIKITCSSNQSDYVRFDGINSLNTRMFSGENISNGIKITSGSIKLKNSGSIIFKPLGNPRYLRPSAVSSVQINITWDKGYGDYDIFEIERRTLSTPFSFLAIAGSNFYADMAVTRYHSYWYRVRAVKYTGERSDFSDELRVFADDTQQARGNNFKNN